LTIATWCPAALFGRPGQQAELLIHHRPAAHFLAQCGFPDNQVNFRVDLAAKNGFLPGRDRFRRSVLLYDAPYA
jgi:hypothetical protein